MKEYIKITGDTDNILESCDLVLEWGQRVIDEGKDIYAAYLLHFNIAIDLGTDFLRSAVLPSMQYLAREVGNQPHHNETVVEMFSKLLHV